MLRLRLRVLDPAWLTIPLCHACAVSMSHKNGCIVALIFWVAATNLGMHSSAVWGVELFE